MHHVDLLPEEGVGGGGGGGEKAAAWAMGEMAVAVVRAMAVVMSAIKEMGSAVAGYVWVAIGYKQLLAEHCTFAPNLLSLPRRLSSV